MGKITFIVGGARSGKSSYALGLAKKFKKTAFIATCEPKDTEMKNRIKLHQKKRPLGWQTFEEYTDIVKTIEKYGDNFDCLIIDCLTLWVSNLMLKRYTQEKIEEKMRDILTILKKGRANAIIVSNEVGLGLVPENKLGRKFRDIAGRINQITASVSDKVVFMACGLPIQIKDKKNG